MPAAAQRPWKLGPQGASQARLTGRHNTIDFAERRRYQGPDPCADAYIKSSNETTRIVPAALAKGTRS